MAENRSPEAFWRTDNAGHLLHLARDTFIREKLERLHERGYAQVRETHMPLVQSLDLAGTRLTELARRAAFTKQRMRELVNMMEVLGFIERRPDPEDGRAKIVSFSQAGLHLMDSLQQAISQAETHMEAVLGDDFVSELKVKLIRYRADHRESQIAPMGEGWRNRNVGRLMTVGRSLFVEDLLRMANAGEDTVIHEVHLTIFRNLSMEGARLTDLAAASDMTKQAMLELVDRAEELGFVERRADAEDRRAKFVMFTTLGRKRLSRLRIAVEEAEEAMAQSFTRDFFVEARTHLKLYASRIEPAPVRSLAS